jgi:phosphatidylglycerophosphate synthase
MLKQRIPIILIWLRFAFGILFFTLSFLQFNHFGLTAIILIATGLLSDILDGIIARKLGVSTEKLRRLDSTIDQAFWLLVIAGLFIRYPEFLSHHYQQILAIIILEVSCYLLSYLRFRKEVATHAISSKIWTLSLFICLVQVISTGDSGILFQICFYLGLVSRLEIFLILILLPRWTNDVPSVFHAWKLKNGQPINRNDLFNG